MQQQGPREILCPVDFSDTSALGLRFAGAMAKCSGAHLTVVYADPFLPPPYITHSRREQVRQQLQESKEEALRSLNEFVQNRLDPPPPPLRTKLVEALAVDGIFQAAEEIAADLIAMGTHGRSGFNRLMLGSVAERVLRQATIPVLTVRPGAGGPEPFPVVRHVVCPVNNTQLALRSLEHAARLAHCFSAELTVLHVREDTAKDRIEDLCAWVPGEARSLCSVHEVTRTGEAAREILSAAAELQCDLLVMGSRHRRFFDSTILGTTTVRVVRHAPCAVLTVAVEED